MASVSIITVTTTDEDELGNSTTSTTEQVFPWGWPQQGGMCLADGSSVESVSSDAPAVVSQTRLLGPFGAAPKPADLIVVHDHSAAMNGEWQVDGAAVEYLSPSGWSPGFQVAVKRAN